MFIYFLSRKLCKFSVLLAPNIIIGPTIHAIASPVILNPSILRENIPLNSCFQKSYQYTLHNNINMSSIIIILI